VHQTIIYVVYATLSHISLGLAYIVYQLDMPHSGGQLQIKIYEERTSAFPKYFYL